jgi:hypothetical protein
MLYASAQMLAQSLRDRLPLQPLQATSCPLVISRCHVRCLLVLTERHLVFGRIRE